MQLGLILTISQKNFLEYFHTPITKEITTKFIVKNKRSKTKTSNNVFARYTSKFTESRNTIIFLVMNICFN